MEWFNEMIVEMSLYVINVEELVFEMCLFEEFEIEINIIFDNFFYLFGGEIVFVDDREEEIWEELFEDDENVEEVIDGGYQENLFGEGEEKLLYYGVRIIFGVSLLLIIIFVMRY